MQADDDDLDLFGEETEEEAAAAAEREAAKKAAGAKKKESEFLLILGSFRYFVWKEVFALRCIDAFHSFDLIHANLTEKKSVFFSSSDCTFSTVRDVYGVYNEILAVSNCETGY